MTRASRTPSACNSTATTSPARRAPSVPAARTAQIACRRFASMPLVVMVRSRHRAMPIQTASASCAGPAPVPTAPSARRAISTANARRASATPEAADVPRARSDNRARTTPIARRRTAPFKRRKCARPVRRAACARTTRTAPRRATRRTGGAADDTAALGGHVLRCSACWESIVDSTWCRI